jgi:hypothetical protein
MLLTANTLLILLKLWKSYWYKLHLQYQDFGHLTRYHPQQLVLSSEIPKPLIFTNAPYIGITLVCIYINLRLELDNCGL